MLQQFNQLYRRVGIRRINDLISPETVQAVELPKRCALHYLSGVVDSPEVDLSRPMFSAYTKKINVRWITEYAQEPMGVVRKLTYNTTLETNDWYKNNRAKVNRVSVTSLLSADDQTLEVLNYSHLSKSYSYSDTPMAKFYEFENKYRTIFATMAKLGSANTHEHFLEVRIGEDLLSKSILDMFQDKINPSMLKIFDEDYKLLILEFWKWFNPSLRHSSILNVFEVKDMPKFTFVFTNAHGQSVYLSLAYLNNWIKGEETLKEAGPGTQLDYEVMQKVFLKFLISMNSFIDEEFIPEPEAQAQPEQEDTQDDPDDVEDQATGIKKMPDSAIKTKSVKEISDVGVLESESLEAKLKDIDEDLKAQETKTKKVLASMDAVVDKDGQITQTATVALSIEEITAKYFVPADPISKMREQVESLGDRKDVSAADYRTMLKRINDSQTVANPYDPKVLIKDTAVHANDIIISKEKCQLAVDGPSNIVDPSMNNSTLSGFTSEYVHSVLKKEIIDMVKGVQGAGVLVKEYDVDVTHSVLGSYEDHRIVLQPVQGVTSPLHIRLPVVKEDGTFLANGNKYSMRAQRVDQPIRKIEPSVVALTSYYGKTFVGLSEKKAQSQTAWLITKIAQLSQTQPDLVKEVAYADVYDSYNQAPFIYGVLSKNFRLLRIDDMVLNFSHVDRKKIADEQFLANEDYYFCGYTLSKQPVAISKDNKFFVWEKGVWMPRGSLYQILGLAENDGPLDAASLNVFSKPVPVALVLSYRMGLSNLLVLLQSKYGLQYKFVEGKRLTGLEDNQYSIRFADGFLVADKCLHPNKAADLILAGLKDYEKETKNYPFEDFNHKHIYLNLLRAKGMTVMYLNEIDNLMDMFVDPITRRILEQMKEPLTLEGLLIRSSELLTTYDHPSSQDMRYQRIRGYERFAGVMYSELVNSIRTYRSKTNKTRSKIDMSPYQVWGTIMQDPANKLVEDINPIQNVKHQEIVTYVGVGGRDKGTINKKSRAYHINDIGTISEASVDSSDVGINTYMSCDPKLGNMYGTVNFGEGGKASTNMLSSSIMLAPGSTNDD